MSHRVQMGPGGSHSRRSDSPATTPFHHFFKIVLHTTLKDKKLRIPDKFVRKYGEDLLDVAEIVVLNGDDDVWKMRLTKTQNNIWFDGGDWQEFVQRYSIDYGHLLVFGYKGLSNFDVLIFDKTACEIDYPNGKGPNTTDIHGDNNLFCRGDQMEGDDDSVEIMGSAANTCPGDTKSKDKSKSNLYDKVFRPKCEEDTELVASGLARASQTSQGRGPIHAARMFETKNPSFMFIMRPYNTKKHIVYVPAGFAKRYLSNTSQNIKLQVSDGREWPVRIIRLSQSRCALSRGWKEFCRDNNLEEGDVCVLELMERKNVVMNVSIFRAVDF